ncbi:MAG: KEOPS complex subunit Pcc1 [Thermoplasmata archaeon]
MVNEAKIKIEIDSPEKILKSIEIENRGYVKSNIFKNGIEFEMESNDLKSLWRTVDDLLMALEISFMIIYGDVFHEQ